MKSIKPKADYLAPSSYEVLYRCGKCGYSFALADNNFLYCPHCGNKIDWGVVKEVNEGYKSAYHSANYQDKQQMMRQLDLFNATMTDGEPRRLKQTEATKKAILSSNISYYLSQGWTKEDLIAKGFFTEEDFKA